jgi:SAM-dependent methyltransferase
MLKETGERLLPDRQRDELLYAEHLARYRFAAYFARDRRVLDAGSGEGYGTAILAVAGADSVVGLDVDGEVVSHAREQYRLNFVQGDICELSFEDASLDLIVCFETIEHVSDAPRALAEFRRVLGPEGLLVISTPNSHEYLVDNEFHEREFTSEEFDQLLSKHFPERLRLYQHNWLLSSILDEQQFRTDENAPLELDLAKTLSLEPGRELYTIVVCGPIGQPVRQVAVASGIYEAHRLSADLEAWRERSDLAEQQREGWEKRATTAERQREGWEKRATTAERQREGWEDRAREAERQVAETREQLARAEHALKQLVASVSWRITRPLRALGAVVRGFS